MLCRLLRPAARAAPLRVRSIHAGAIVTASGESLCQRKQEIGGTDHFAAFFAGRPARCNGNRKTLRTMLEAVMPFSVQMAFTCFSSSGLSSTTILAIQYYVHADCC